MKMKVRVMVAGSIIVGVLASWGCAARRGGEQSGVENPQSGKAGAVRQLRDKQGPLLEVDAADQDCRADGDCVLTMVRCSCDCGLPVNKVHRDKYQAAQGQMCKEYRGIMCKMKCDERVACVDAKCEAARR
ncbi:MAG: hypothetical protein HYY84_08365 [Deltaproteobacteria bacterium]|nr:hypothetical protein [Deltaproteobacteria bacterium]